jgi:hypothetical protein
MSKQEDESLTDHLAIFFAVLLALIAITSCEDPDKVSPTILDPQYPPHAKLVEEEYHMRVATEARIKIDSFIMLRCQTTDTAVWNRCEDSVQALSEWARQEIGDTNMVKYANMKYTGKKIPCAIGDSVLIFYKLTPKG